MYTFPTGVWMLPRRSLINSLLFFTFSTASPISSSATTVPMDDGERESKHEPSLSISASQALGARVVISLCIMLSIQMQVYTCVHVYTCKYLHVNTYMYIQGIIIITSAYLHCHMRETCDDFAGVRHSCSIKCTHTRGQ